MTTHKRKVSLRASKPNWWKAECLKTWGKPAVKPSVILEAITIGSAGIPGIGYVSPLEFEKELAAKKKGTTVIRVGQVAGGRQKFLCLPSFAEAKVGKRITAKE